MWTVDQDQADGDKVILLPDINSRELRNLVDNLYGEYPCYGWSDVETQQQRMIVETEDAAEVPLANVALVNYNFAPCTVHLPIRSLAVLRWNPTCFVL